MALIPVCIRGFAQSPYAYGDFSVTNRVLTGNVSIRENKSCIPICEISHTGIAVCIWGSPYVNRRGLLKKTYGDPITHNEVVHIRGLTYTSPGSTLVSPAFAFGYPGTCRVGRHSALIAFAMSAPPLYSLCM
jgi:hypothetical protein